MPRLPENYRRKKAVEPSQLQKWGRAFSTPMGSDCGMRVLLIAVVLACGVANQSSSQSVRREDSRLTATAKHNVQEEIRTAAATGVLLDWTTGNVLITADKERPVIATG
jgi:hypothetical protein